VDFKRERKEREGESAEDDQNANNDKPPQTIEKGRCKRTAVFFVILFRHQHLMNHGIEKVSWFHAAYPDQQSHEIPAKENEDEKEEKPSTPWFLLYPQSC